MLIHNDIEQGSEAWHLLRIGRPTASNFHRIISPTGKKSEQSDQYMRELIAERIRGARFEKFKKTASMERGNELEEQAAQTYALLRGIEPQKVGFITNDAGTVGCSPDRLLGDDGILEIKCPDPDTMVSYMLKGKLEQTYRPQTQGQLWIAEKKWCDTIAYDDLMVPVIMPSERDNSFIMDLSRLMKEFLANMQQAMEDLHKKGYITQ